MVVINVVGVDVDEKFSLVTSCLAGISDLENRILRIRSQRRLLHDSIRSLCELLEYPNVEQNEVNEQTSVQSVRASPQPCGCGNGSHNAVILEKPFKDNYMTEANACIQRARETLLRTINPPDEQELESVIRQTRAFCWPSCDKSMIPHLLESPESDKGVLWWAGKPLLETNGRLTLGSYVGQNEKTKITVTVRPRNGEQPPRSPCIEAETHKNIISYLHKRQQELKQLDADDDDSYFSSEWSNPRGLKNGLTGNTGEIRFRV